MQKALSEAVTVKETISKAIEGGWLEVKSAPGCYDLELAPLFLDPSFWQSLGKALGWDEDSIALNSYWHSFIDHLADGKDAESFFQPLQG